MDKINKQKNNILIDSSYSINEENNNYKINESQNLKNNYNFNTYKNKKHVKISDEIIFIDVENWKKYNLEQTAEENLEDYLEELEKENKDKEREKNNNKKKKSKSDNVTCTCNII